MSQVAMDVENANPNKRRDSDLLAWKKGLPFANNPRGVLIHRVRSAGTYFHHGVLSHHFVHYWCGNVTTFEKNILVAEPPEGRIVCARCEAIAVSNGLPTVDELVGKHVHVGGTRAFKTCCRDDIN